MPLPSFRACAALVTLVATVPFRALEAPQPPVSFAKDVLPLLAHRCFECHGNGKRKGDLDLTSRELLLKGGKDGPAIVVAKSDQSILIQRVTSADPDERMPNKGEPLTKDEIATLKAWIDQGAPWDTTVAPLPDKPKVKSRAVTLPAGEGNPVDRLLAGYFAQHHANVTEQADDRRF